MRLLLDEEILPRLERPGCYVGPLDGDRNRLAPANATRVVLLWPSRPENSELPPTVAPVSAALRRRLGVPIAFAPAPAADLEAQLRQHGLPPFSRPAWTPLTAHSVWLAWLDQPLQLFGLLTLIEASGLPLRAVDRVGMEAPRILVAGPGSRCLGELVRLYADGCMVSDDLEQMAAVVDGLLDGGTDALQRAVRDGSVLPKVTTASAPATGSAPAGGDAEAQVPHRREVEPKPLFVEELRQAGARCGLERSVPWVEFDVGPASAPLRTQLSLPPSTILVSHLAEALADPRTLVRLRFCVGLPGERRADWASIPLFAREVVRAAPRGASQVAAEVTVATSPWRAPVEAPATPERLQEALRWVRKELTTQHVRVRCGDPVRGWASGLLASGSVDLGALIESLHRGGLRRDDSPEVARFENWARVLELASAEGGGGHRGKPVPEAAPTELALDPAPTASADEAGVTGPDRWRRWRCLVPHDFDYRVEYAKTGWLRHLTHGETVALLLRAFAGARLEVATSGVVRPRTKIQFGPQLPVGVEGLAEVFDIGLVRKSCEVKDRVNAQLPEGLHVRQACFLPRAAHRLALARVERASYRARILARHGCGHGDLATELQPRVDALASQPVWVAAVPGSAGDHVEVDVGTQVSNLRVRRLEDDDGVELSFDLDLTGPGRKCKPIELLSILLGDLVQDVRSIPVCRSSLLARRGTHDPRLWSPMDHARWLLSDIKSKAKLCA